MLHIGCHVRDIIEQNPALMRFFISLTKAKISTKSTLVLKAIIVIQPNLTHMTSFHEMTIHFISCSNQIK